MMTRGFLGALGAIVLTATPAAHAMSVGTVDISGGFSGVPQVVSYDSIAGADHIEVSHNSIDLAVRSLNGGVIIENHSSCSGSGTSTVICRWISLSGHLEVNGGAGGDRLDTRGWAAPAVVTGDAGYDEILTGAGADQISGGDGNDILVAGGGDDRIWAGIGADQLYGQDGADTLYSNDVEPLGAKDHLDCGLGIDSATWIAPDFATGCESRF